DDRDPAERFHERRFDLGIGPAIATDAPRARAGHAGRPADDPDLARWRAVEQVGHGGRERDGAARAIEHRERAEPALAERLGPVADDTREPRDRDRGL